MERYIIILLLNFTVFMRNKLTSKNLLERNTYKSIEYVFKFYNDKKLCTTSTNGKVFRKILGKLKCLSTQCV